MAEESEAVRECIVRLAGPEVLARERAAHELFRIGCASAEPILKKWFADQEMRALASTGKALLTVGVAVEPERFSVIRARFGTPRLADVPADLDAVEFDLVFAHGVRLDILTTRDLAGNGAMARFLTRWGEGIQQVECDVRDVARATEILRARFALEPVYPAVRDGADGTRVNFFLMPANEGRRILMELVEVPSKSKSSRISRT